MKQIHKLNTITGGASEAERAAAGFTVGAATWLVLSSFVIEVHKQSSPSKNIPLGQLKLCPLGVGIVASSAILGSYLIDTEYGNACLSRAKSCYQSMKNSVSNFFTQN